MITRNNTGPPSFAEAAAVMMSGGQTVVGGSSKLIQRNFYENGIYKAKDDDADGYSEVGVYVQTKANVETLTVTENGTYSATPPLDGYNPVIVNVPKGGYTLKPNTPVEDIIDFASENNAEISQEDAEYSFAVHTYPYTGQEYPSGTSEALPRSFYCGTEFIVYKNGVYYKSQYALYTFPIRYRFINWGFNPETGEASYTYYDDGGPWSPPTGERTDTMIFPELIGFLTGDKPVTIAN